MTLDQLQALKAVVQLGSFRKAAEYLCLSQPAISSSIKKLEIEFDCQLFDRTAYRPQLTPTGQVFYTKAVLLLEDADNLKTMGHQLSEGELEIRIAVENLFPVIPLSLLLKQFFADYPQTRMLLAFDTSAGTLSRLKNNKADIILNCHTGALEKNYCRHPLNTIDFMPVCHRDYYREHKDHLLDNSIVLISETGFEDQNVSEGILKNMTPLVVNDLSIKKQCIHAKLGWGRLPKHLIEDELASGTFHTIKDTGFENRVMTMQLIHKDSTFLGPVTQKLISTIKNHPW